MLQQRRGKFHRSLQREERERIFHRIRLELLSEGPQTGEPTDKMQDEILESIAYFNTQQQPLDFGVINNYIIKFKGPFRPQLIEQLIPIALEKYSSNAHALACAGNLLSKCHEIEVIHRMDMRKVVKGLIDANVIEGRDANKEGRKETNKEGREEINNGKPLAFLLAQLIALAKDKQSFADLPQYYPHIIKSAGQFQIVTLLLLVEGSIFRMLHPPSSVLQSYLSQEIPFERVSQVGVSKLLEMIGNCLRFNDSEEYYQAASQWIERGLKDSRFPLGLKPDLIRLMTMMIRQRTSSFFIDFVEKLTVFKEIMYQARFGGFGCKQPALQFVATLVVVTSPEILRHYVQEHQLMEVMVFSLELDLEIDTALKMLNGLARILNANSFLVNKAHFLNLHYHLQRYNDPHFHNDIIKAANNLQTLMNPK